MPVSAGFARGLATEKRNSGAREIGAEAWDARSERISNRFEN
jgi:hypothetical protein